MDGIIKIGRKRVTDEFVVRRVAQLVCGIDFADQGDWSSKDGEAPYRDAANDKWQLSGGNNHWLRKESPNTWKFSARRSAIDEESFNALVVFLNFIFK